MLKVENVMLSIIPEVIRVVHSAEPCGDGDVCGRRRFRLAAGSAD